MRILHGSRGNGLSIEKTDQLVPSQGRLISGELHGVVGARVVWYVSERVALRLEFSFGGNSAGLRRVLAAGSFGANIWLGDCWSVWKP